MLFWLCSIPRRIDASQIANRIRHPLSQQASPGHEREELNAAGMLFSQFWSPAPCAFGFAVSPDGVLG
jgi:hypothetical protein